MCICVTLHIDTSNLFRHNFENCPFPWFSHQSCLSRPSSQWPALGALMENCGRRQFSKLWREASLYLYVMWVVSSRKLFVSCHRTSNCRTTSQKFPLSFHVLNNFRRQWQNIYKFVEYLFIAVNCPIEWFLYKHVWTQILIHIYIEVSSQKLTIEKKPMQAWSLLERKPKSNRGIF